MSGKTKKLFALLVSLMLVFAMLSSCAPAVSTEPTPTPDSNTPAPAETEEPEPTEIPPFNFDGATISMAANFDLTPSEDTQEGVTRKELQDAAEAKYNVKIEYLVLSNEEYMDKLVTSIMGGDPYATMFYMGSPGAVPSLVKQDMFLAVEDIDTVPIDLDYTLPLDDLRKVAGYNGKTYGFGTNTRVDSIGVYYNRKLMADAGYPDPHTWIETKEWTWDKFREIAIDMTKDLDEDGNIDQWGSMTYAGDWIWFLTLASGGKLYDMENNKQMLDDPKTIAAMDYIYKLFNEDKVVKPGGWAFMNDFPVGNIALLPSFSWYGGMIKNSEIGDGYGFLPMPLAEGQTNYINPARQISAYFMSRGTENPGHVLNVWKELQIWEQERPSAYNLAQYANEDDIAVAEMLEDGEMNFDFFAGLHDGIIDQVGNALANGEMTGAQAAQAFGPQLQDKFDGK